MAYKQYSEAEQTESIIRLATNRYDYKTTSEQLGISIPTLRRWNKVVPKKTVPELLDRAISRMLMVIPDKWDGNSWAIALGILMDKWLLLQGKATSRVANLVEGLEKLDDAELDQLVSEFQAAANAEPAKD